MKPVCMSGSFKKVLQGCRFRLDDKDIKTAVVQQFHQQTKGCFAEGESSPVSMPMGTIFIGLTSFHQKNPQTGFIWLTLIYLYYISISCTMHF
jgi:hypothetical protein